MGTEGHQGSDPALPARGGTPDRAVTFESGFDGLLSAQSVAVIGASAGNERSPGRITARNLLEAGRITVSLVHPRAAPILGITPVRTIRELPEVPDVLVVAVESFSVVAAVEAGLERGCRHFVILSSTQAGDDRSVDARLRDLVDSGQAKILGASSGGLLDLNARMYLGFSTLVEQQDHLLAGDVAFISQSGGVATYTMAAGMRRGIGFSHYVAVGTELGFDVLDVAVALAQRREVATICIYMESVGDPGKFIAAADEVHDRGKDLAVLWAGRRSAARAAARSHTGALAIPSRFVEGLCAHSSVALARTPEELLDTVQVMRTKRVRACSTAIATVSGGFSVILSDLAEEQGHSLPALSPQAETALRAALPFNAAVMNPLDLGGIRNTSAIGAALQILDQEAQFDNIVLFLGCGGASAAAAADAIITARPARACFMVIWLAGPASALGSLRAAGVEVFESTEGCLAALSRSAVPAPGGSFGAPEVVEDSAPDDDGGILIQEVASKTLLERYGLPMPARIYARGPAEAVERAREVDPPWVLKVDKPGLAHKAAAGGVLLNLATPEELERAVTEMTRRFGASIDGFIVESMLHGDLELILSARRDPRLGESLMVGLGGVHANAINSVAVRPAPLGPGELAAMLSETLAGRILASGPHSTARRVIAELEHVAQMLLECLDEHSTFTNIELNPVLVDLEAGSTAILDALIQADQ